jgi:hypothetical protein
MNRYFLIGLLICVIILSNCGKAIFREIDCRDFELQQEYYWFNSIKGDSINFKSESNKNKGFIVADKWIEHRTKYTSDTGCGCMDLSGLLIANASDTIHLVNQLTYVEDNEGTSYETLIFIIDGVRTDFFETSITLLTSYIIEGITLSDVKKFEYPETENPNIKSIYLAKNIGVVKIEMTDGTVWVNTDLQEKPPTSISEFRFKTNICE